MALDCPRCQQAMNVHRIQPPDHERPIAIDQCGRCGGVWMDEGEANLVCPLVAYLDKRSCYLQAINRGQQKRAEAVGESQSIVGQLIEALVNAFLVPPPDERGPRHDP